MEIKIPTTVNNSGNKEFGRLRLKILNTVEISDVEGLKELTTRNILTGYNTILQYRQKKNSLEENYRHIKVGERGYQSKLTNKKVSHNISSEFGRNSHKWNTRR